MNNQSNAEVAAMLPETVPVNVEVDRNEIVDSVDSVNADILNELSSEDKLKPLTTKVASLAILATVGYAVSRGYHPGTELHGAHEVHSHVDQYAALSVFGIRKALSSKVRKATVGVAEAGRRVVEKTTTDLITGNAQRKEQNVAALEMRFPDDGSKPQGFLERRDGFVANRRRNRMTKRQASIDHKKKIFGEDVGTQKQLDRLKAERYTPGHKRSEKKAYLQTKRDQDIIHRNRRRMEKSMGMRYSPVKYDPIKDARATQIERASEKILGPTPTPTPNPWERVLELAEAEGTDSFSGLVYIDGVTEQQYMIGGPDLNGRWLIQPYGNSGEKGRPFYMDEAKLSDHLENREVYIVGYEHESTANIVYNPTAAGGIQTESDNVAIMGDDTWANVQELKRAAGVDDLIGLTWSDTVFEQRVAESFDNRGLYTVCSYNAAGELIDTTKVDTAGLRAQFMNKSRDVRLISF